MVLPIEISVEKAWVQSYTLIGNGVVCTEELDLVEEKQDHEDYRMEQHKGRIYQAYKKKGSPLFFPSGLGLVKSAT